MGFFSKLFASRPSSTASLEKSTMQISTPTLNEKESHFSSDASSVSSKSSCLSSAPTKVFPKPLQGTSFSDLPKTYLHMPGYDLAKLGSTTSDRSTRSQKRASFRPEYDNSQRGRKQQSIYPLYHPETAASQLVTSQFHFLCGHFP